MDTVAFGANLSSGKSQTIRSDETRRTLVEDKIFLLESIRNHLDYTLRYEHRFHIVDVQFMEKTLHKLKLVIGLYTSLLGDDTNFNALNKAFFSTFHWIEQTFRDEVVQTTNRRISVIHIYTLEALLNDLQQMGDELLHYRPSLMTQLFNEMFGKRK